MSANLVSTWAAARDRLREAGVDTPVLDARLLLEAGAGVTRLDIVTDPYRELDDAQAQAVDALVARRAAREPVSHILGRKDFWTFSLTVTPAVLTPRPETETLVQAALDIVKPDAQARVLDLGVGSGAILFAILTDRPGASGVGIDASADALNVAKFNAALLGLGDRAELVEGDWSAGVDGEFDLVVANPPYVRTHEITALAPEVSRHEPRLALDGGVDGLDAYRAILPLLPRLLRPDGAFAFEVGEGQAEAVWALADQAGLAPAGVREDLAGKSRVVWGYWRKHPQELAQQSSEG